jgi:hypothetical protein
MKNLSFFLFFGVILAHWIRIRNLYADPDPDPEAQINADPCGCGSGYGSGSETLAKSKRIIMEGGGPVIGRIVLG